MSREQEYKTAVKQKEIAELSAGVTRAIVTLIHVDDFIQRTARIFLEYTDENGNIDLSRVPENLIFDNVALLYKLQHGAFKGDASLLNADIRLISAYNEFDYAAYTKKMHEMILADESSKSSDKHKE